MKVIGVLAIGLGLILIVIGITGTQSQVLADLKAVNPKLRSATGTTGATGAVGGTVGSATGTNNSGGGSGVVAV